MAFFAGITARAPLLLIGCGHMGGALLRAWLRKGLPARNVVIADPHPRGLPRQRGLRVFTDAADALAKHPSPRVAVVAVKPQVLTEALKAARRLDVKKTLILSITAGAHIRTIERALGKPARAVRAMPNTPAALGRGIAVMTANARANAADRKLAAALLKAGGKVIATGNEKLLDAVTAVSGSGPAYFYLMAEALAAAGVKTGLPKVMARALALETFLGAAALLEASGANPEDLRKRVTSKG
ncbi:MAG TPA: pyrroline-5-carboxylate reductase, partial [Sphingomonadales bacterium]|nr:pyrroline-5-carboxylate reductase [Sphingomonadales bacterium]